MTTSEGRGLRFALARSGEASAAQRVSIGVLVDGERKASAATDPTITLLDLFSYVADVLSYYQEQVANESYLGIHRGEDRTSLRIELGEGLRPAVCAIADDQRIYLVTVGSQVESGHVTFGPGKEGRRPPSAEVVSATYRRKRDNRGEVELRGLDLGDSFAVLVLGDPRIARRCFYFLRHAS